MYNLFVLTIFMVMSVILILITEICLLFLTLVKYSRKAFIYTLFTLRYQGTVQNFDYYEQQ